MQSTEGCCITSWRINNQEQLFVSRVTPFSQHCDFRGGVCIIFPQHSKWNFGRHHGFGRDVMWSLIRGPEYLPNGDVFVDIGLSGDHYTQSMWNYECTIQYRITLHSSQLSMDLKVMNTSKYYNFDFHIMLQCYIKLTNLFDVVVSGLQNCLTDDRLRAIGTSMVRQKEETFKIMGHIDTTFHQTPNEIKLYIGDNKLVQITKENIPDLKLWNPGQTVVRDLDSDEYKYFIAIEGGWIYKKHPLKANSEWSISINLEMIDLTKKKTGYKNFYDNFKGYC